MKLYATITSERATKGQGGNEFLEVKIKDEGSYPLYIMRIYPKTGIKPLKLLLWKDKSVKLEEVETLENEKKLKGEKQKGEKCKLCNNDVYGKLNYCYKHRPAF